MIVTLKSWKKITIITIIIHCQYCWWRQSCTSYPIIYKVLYIQTVGFSPDFNSYHHHATHRSHRPDPSAPDFPGHFSDPPWIPSNPTIWGTSPFSSAAFRTQDGPLEKPVISKVQYTTPFFWGYNFRYPKCQQKKKIHAKNVPKKKQFSAWRITWVT